MDAYKVEIALGNAAMQTPEDVAGALRDLADRLEGRHTWPEVGQRIMDANGNQVGTAWAEGEADDESDDDESDDDEPEGWEHYSEADAASDAGL